MKHKSEVPFILKNFFRMIDKQFGASIKKVRSDNGIKFLGHDCKVLFHSSGTVHERSCAYTPQQNGVVERKHRHHVEVTRAVSF